MMLCRIYTRTWDNKLLDHGFDAPKSWESRSAFLRRVATEVAINPYCVRKMLANVVVKPVDEHFATHEIIF